MVKVKSDPSILSRKVMIQKLHIPRAPSAKASLPEPWSMTLTHLLS